MVTTENEDLGNDRVPGPASEPSKPKRRPGRPKGLGKVPGSGRKAGAKNWTSDEIRNALLGQSKAVDTIAAICAGQQFQVSGPTGKTQRVYPTLQERLRAAELVLKKVLPDLQAQSIEMTGKDGKDLLPAAEDPRQLSRAILTVLGSAVFQDAPYADSETGIADTDTAFDAKHFMTAPCFDAGEFDDTDPLDLSDGPTEPAIGERILCGDAGAWVEKTPDGRWRVMHSDGSLHRYCLNREEAETQATHLRW